MNDDKLSKLLERDRAMRKARDEVLHRVAAWLIGFGYTKAGEGHFVQTFNGLTFHIGFQKKSSGRNVRVMCSIKDSAGSMLSGPWSDRYESRNSPNGRKYQFAWNTREADIARSAAEFCQYIEDVVFLWFRDNGAGDAGAHR